MSITQIKSMVQFSRGGNLVWSTMTSILPVGVVSFSIDDGVFKLGDGVTPYSQLPVLFTYGELVSAQGGVSGLFEEPTIAQNGNIVVIEFDAGSNVIRYAVSDITLAGLLTSISTIETTNIDQDTEIGELIAIALGIDIGINTAGDGNIITIQNRRYSNSGTTETGMQAQIASGVTFVPGSHLEEIELYSDVAKNHKVDKLALKDGGTYYVEVVGFNNNAVSVVYGLTSTNTGVVITNISGGLFSVRFNNLTGGTHDDVPVILVASIDSNTGNAKIEKAVACLVQRNRIIAAVYGGISNDQFSAVAVDSSNNIICAGSASSESVGSTYGLVVKFDSDLNIIVRKYYGPGAFYNVTADKLNNIICVGYTSSEGSGSNDALVVKFASDLSIIARKRYGGTGADYFNDVITDSSNNIICVGDVGSEGSGACSALIVKFASDLSITARKIYDGTYADYFRGVAVDSSNNIICVGSTGSEGTSGEALVIKFASDLSIIARKRYGGAVGDTFYSVAVDSSNNIICTGFTTSEGTGGDALVVKFNSDLSAMSLRKRYGGTGADYFNNVAVDSSDNIICAGNTNSEGAGGIDALVVKFPATYTLSGTTTGTILTGLTLADSNLTLADSGLTLADSTLSLADSGLTLADSTLTLADSTLTLERDVIIA